MVRTLGLFFAMFCGCITWSGTGAATLGFLPGSQQVRLGDQATVEVVVSDLGGAQIGAYDFDVSWDETIVSLASVSFGSFLDGPTLSFQDFDIGAGIVNVAEVSFGSLANQDGVIGFALFTLVFDTLDTGVSPLSFSGGISPDFDFLGDGTGQALATSVMAGEITVVPLPASLLLLFSGLVALGAARIR